MKLLPLFCSFFVASVFAASSIPDQDSGYVTVRQSAHMFWWLMGSDLPDRENAPTIIWLQGGPGASSTGYGNFEEIGPLDLNLQPRASTWLTRANLIFPDNPVGTGYSYVDNLNALTSNNSQIAEDFSVLLKNIFQVYPALTKTPLYFFCESYGGKMTAKIAETLIKKVESGSFPAFNFKGVALGDSWISGMESVRSWPEYLYQFSVIDETQLIQLNNQVQQLQALIDKGNWEQATNKWSSIETLVQFYGNGVNFYNVLQHNVEDTLLMSLSEEKKILQQEQKEKVDLSSSIRRHVHLSAGDSLSSLMNGPIKQQLNIPSSVTWGGQSNAVFTALSGDFMKPAVDSVEFLLNYTSLSTTARAVPSFSIVSVYSGQLDLICATPGTLAWMQQLKDSKNWSGYAAWEASIKRALYADSSAQAQGDVQGYSKRVKGFAFYSINNAGHMVPSDNAYVALAMVDEILAA